MKVQRLVGDYNIYNNPTTKALQYFNPPEAKPSQRLAFLSYPFLKAKAKAESAQKNIDDIVWTIMWIIEVLNKESLR